jgi:competence protein ComEC
VLAAARLLPNRGVAAAALLILGSAGVLATTLRFPDGRLSVTMLDVGQADASVVRTPRGRIILIDSGGRLEHGTGAQDASPAEEAGERVVLAYLRREGIRRVDLLINTHPHGDHVGGCAPIVNALTVRTIFDSGQPYAGRAYRDCMAAARAHAVPVVLARRGMRWTSGDGVTLDVLAPAMPFLADTGDDVNENSIVVMLHDRTFRELFMGDAGEASEARLLASGDDLHADVVKVGHHGSRYASTPTFVAAVHPRIALISVGRHNTFGHPAPGTIASWQAVGADVLRTDRCGAISLVDGSPTTLLRCAHSIRSGPSTDGIVRFFESDLALDERDSRAGPGARAVSLAHSTGLRRSLTCGRNHVRPIILSASA